MTGLPRFYFSFLAGLLVALALGCSTTEKRAQVMIVVDAESAMKAATRSLVVRISSGARDSELRLSSEHPIPGASLDWPVTIAVAPLDFDVSRRFRVEVFAIDDGGERIGAVRAQTGFLAERTLSLSLLFADSCRDMLCDETTYCRSGSCDTAIVPPSELEPYQPPAGDDAGEDASEADAGDADSDVEGDAAIEDAGDATLEDAGDAAIGDSAIDAEPDAGECIPTPETCDVDDNDCDGRVDEGFVDIDPDACGECEAEPCAAGQYCAGFCAVPTVEPLLFLDGSATSDVTSIAPRHAADGDLAGYCVGGSFRNGSLTVGSFSSAGIATANERPFLVCCSGADGCTHTYPSFVYASDDAVIDSVVTNDDGTRVCAAGRAPMGIDFGSGVIEGSFVVCYGTATQLWYQHVVSTSALPPSMDLVLLEDDTLVAAMTGSGNFTIGTTMLTGGERTNFGLAFFDPSGVVSSFRESTGSGRERVTALGASDDSRTVFLGVDYNNGTIELDSVSHTATIAETPSLVLAVDVETHTVETEHTVDQRTVAFHGTSALEHAAGSFSTSMSNNAIAEGFSGGAAGRVLGTVTVRPSSATSFTANASAGARGSIVLLGRFSGTLTADGEMLTAAASGESGYVVNADRTGELRWAISVSASTSLSPVVASAQGDATVLVGGHWSGDLTIDGEVIEGDALSRGFLFAVHDTPAP